MIKLTAALRARCSGFGPLVTIPAVTEWGSELGLSTAAPSPRFARFFLVLPCGGPQQGVFRNDSLTRCAYICSILVYHCSQGQNTGGA